MMLNFIFHRSFFFLGNYLLSKPLRVRILLLLFYFIKIKIKIIFMCANFKFKEFLFEKIY
jgi:hypothetical protein